MPKVLFVCLGNICRSPMAESVFAFKVKELGLDIECDSAGTGDWHVGQKPDPRTRKKLEENGIEFASRARQVKAKDFDEFDYIVAMDEANVRDLSRWENAKPAKISLMMDWSPGEQGTAVPDPYYGDASDFELVYQMVSRASEGLIKKIQSV